MNNITTSLLKPAIFALILLPLSLFSQSLEVNQATINFGNTMEDAPDSIQLTIQNPSLTDTVNVTGIQFYETYSKTDFSTSKDQFQLLPGGDEVIWVKFSPRHNITYNSEMVILDDGKRGNLSVDLRGIGRYESYYTPTLNKSEEALKSELKTIITQGYTQRSYNQARDRMYMFIHNEKVNGQGAAQNTIECVYTGREITGYTSRTDAQFNFPDKFNTEHTWPQAMFSSALPMRSDLHHIFPTWDRSNSERASHPFGEITGTANWQDGGSMRKGSLFEPRDLHKGAVARAMLYFVLRYQNYSNFLNTQEAILTQWNRDFPPTPIEHRRNEDIFSYQGNRNPFTDYPQLAERITSFSSNSVAPDRFVLDLPESQIDYGTVPANQDVIYQFLLVNDGNQDISLSNLSLSDPALTFFSGTGADVTFSPGEAHAILVRLNAGGGVNISATLDISTNLPSDPSLSIPITANVVSGVSIDPLKEVNLPVLWPNPATNLLHVEWKGTTGKSVSLKLLDISGRKVLKSSNLPSFGKSTFNLPNLLPGIYFIQLKSGTKRWQEKIIIE